MNEFITVCDKLDDSIRTIEKIREIVLRTVP